MAYGLTSDFLMGQCTNAYDYFGAHFVKQGKTKGVVFRLYAPMASDVSVIGDFNNWDMYSHKMNKVDDTGIWEIFVPGVNDYCAYKFHFKNAKGKYVDRIDPFAFFCEVAPATCSRTFDVNNFIWHDQEFLDSRDRNFDKPMSIYEMHLGSWLKNWENRFSSYEEIADILIPYVKGMGYTHVEFMPIVAHPFLGSWGYQATGFYSCDPRYGNPYQLMSLIDRLHKEGIGVIVDFAPVHFANDKWALKEYDGTCLFEYNNEHRVSPWGSLQFDLGKDPVRSFLMSAVNFYINYYHADGIRIDAVSNLIYWNGNKNDGENSGATEFIRRLNAKMHIEHNDIMMIAEDSSDFAGVTKPTWQNGLEFDYKWDLGWMNDTLKYYALDPIYKKYDHNKLTFSMAYFYSDNFLLPFSHDEVVHGKGTLLNKMWGDYYQKFALLRNLVTYQFAHPGKKLNFMGNEFGSFDEWNENKSLPWELKNFPAHDSISRLYHDLNLIYRAHPAMYIEEHNPERFRWLIVDNSNDSVFAFQRKVNDETLIFVFNMTTNFYDHFGIPMLEEGTYEEIFNTDKDIYGGANQYNGAHIDSVYGYLTIKLASMGACIFKKVK
ncbi:MAG: 1,4-alpha-glucan branching protein GlgB [Bacilli bacterium]|nr:1,4-alpha-glucan branching protein GlgB [Bacilli bacterium]